MTTQDDKTTTGDLTGGPTGPAPGGARRRHRTPLLVGALVVAGSLAAGSVVWLASGSSSTAVASPAGGLTTATSGGSDGAAPAAVPVALVQAARAGVVPWDEPLSVAVSGGVLTGVSGTDPDGDPITGAVGADGTWTSSETLIPGSDYALSAEVVDAAGDTRSVPVTATTSPAEKTLTAGLSPGDGKVVGIVQPVAVRLDRPVEGAADRKAVEERLTVATLPATTGSWRWMSDTELHFRGAEFWQPGTKIQVTAALSRAKLSGGVWGSGTRTSTFRVGDSLTSVVDIDAKTMTVSKDGKVVRTMKASMGRPGYDTRGGTFVVLEKFEDKVMDGSTLAVPANYSTAVRHAVRISNSGTFTHGAPWSVASQGKTNVSHGCINLSPADAEWYFGQAKRGDVVKVVNAVEGPLSYDPGSQDWNMTYAEWKSGSAL